MALFRPREEGLSPRFLVRGEIGSFLGVEGGVGRKVPILSSGVLGGSLPPVLKSPINRRRSSFLVKSSGVLRVANTFVKASLP